jgi:phage protein D
MPDGGQSLRAEIEIDGSPLDAAVEPLIEQVVVDNHVMLPDTFLIVFNDRERDILDKSRIKVGSKVRIKGTALGSQQAESLISGEVTALGADYQSGDSRVVVRGYDPSHRLHRGRQSATYLNQKDSDIARAVANRASLDVGTIDDSGEVHPWVSQANLSDWEFLTGRAGQIGFQVTVSDGKFHFRKPATASDAPGDGDYDSKDPLQLVFGQDLLQFQPRVTSAEQVSSVQLRGWDPDAKKALVGSAEAKTTSAALPSKPADLAATFGSPTYVVVDRPQSTQAGVDAGAAAVADQIASAFVDANGSARGNPKLKAGAAVSVSAVAAPFAGQYTLSQTHHVFDEEGYRTEFQVSGRAQRSLLGLTGGGSAGAGTGGGSPISGLVIAIVTNNDDPNQLGRVKLKFPWLSDSFESDWAPVSQLGAGPDSGAVFLPEVGDEVLVGFGFGDVRQPYVIGGLYNGVDKPKLGSGLVDNGKIKRRGFVSRKGHKLIFLDGDDKSGIALISSDGKIRIGLKETDGQLHIVCDGKIVIESTGDLKLSSQGSLQLSGQSGVKIESGAMVEVSGQTIKLN